ncbi:DUF4440 domain-containing protein [Sphingomonas sp. I4]
MDDDRLWSFEESLWTEGPDNYREKVDAEVVMVLPQPPFVLTGQDAIAAVADTPVWDSAELTERTASRPQEGLIVIGYHVAAQRATSVTRRIAPRPSVAWSMRSGAWSSISRPRRWPRP